MLAEFKAELGKTKSERQSLPFAQAGIASVWSELNTLLAISKADILTDPSTLRMLESATAAKTRELERATQYLFLMTVPSQVAIEEWQLSNRVLTGAGDLIPAIAEQE
jgi:hypothetical protein